jgi:hypothetical protein
MSYCSNTIQTPGTPTLCSGYTAQLTAKAVRCDQARLLQRLQSSSSPCPSSRPSLKSAVNASILEQQASKCNQYKNSPNYVLNQSPCSKNQSLGSASIQTAQQLQQPQTQVILQNSGIPESVRINRLIEQTILNSTNDMNPETRFASYYRVFPPIPCITPESLKNPAIPVASVANRTCHTWPGS